jgi:hypothetical protein
MKGPRHDLTRERAPENGKGIVVMSGTILLRPIGDYLFALHH